MLLVVGNIKNKKRFNINGGARLVWGYFRGDMRGRGRFMWKILKINGFLDVVGKVGYERYKFFIRGVIYVEGCFRGIRVVVACGLDGRRKRLNLGSYLEDCCLREV